MKTNLFRAKNLNSPSQYYSEVEGVILTHSRKYEKDYIDYVNIRFEKSTEDGFSYAECRLPFEEFTKCVGFTEDELYQLEDYLLANQLLIWDLSEEVVNAKST